MSNINFAHFIQWEKIADNEIDPTLAELREMKVNNLVIHPHWWIKDEKNGNFLKKIIRKMQANGFAGSACHGLWGNEYDLNCPDENKRQKIIMSHVSFIENLGDTDCFTYTVHLGERHAGFTKAHLYEQVRKSLDSLLPAAEKNSIKIAMENMIDYDTSVELAELAAEYNHPNLGLCLDTGHAHVKEGLENAIDNMKDYLVTCHLHDNDGSSDQHLPPGYGSIEWQKLVSKLKACPNIINAETEAGDTDNVSRKENWQMFQKVWKESLCKDYH